MEGNIRYCTTSDGIQIAYSITGQGPPLVRVLGWFTHLEYEWKTPFWRVFAERLSDHYTLVRYDGRGTGLSDRDIEGITWEGSIRDLEAVIDAIGLDKVAVFGISQGGPAAIDYAIAHPERVTHLIIYGSFARGYMPDAQMSTFRSLGTPGLGQRCAGPQTVLHRPIHAGQPQQR